MSNIAILNATVAFPAGIEAAARENQIKDRASLFSLVRELGEKQGDGSKSRTKAALLFRDACMLGIAHVAEKVKAGDDAEKVYLALGKAHNSRGKGDDSFEAMSLDTAGKAKSAISHLRSFGRVPVLNQGDTFHALVCEVAKDLGTACSLSPYRAMVKANARVCDAQKAVIGKNRVFRATRDDIAGWIRDEEKAKPLAHEAVTSKLGALTEMSQQYDLPEYLLQAMEFFKSEANTFVSAEIQRLAKA